MASTHPTSPSRDKRRINKSQRARESGEFIPGIDSALNTMLTPAPSSASDGGRSSKQSTPSLESRASQDAAGNATKRPARRPQARRTVAARPASAAQERQSMIDAQRHDALQDRALTFLRSRGLKIWSWPGAEPIDPLKLTPSERRWREERDRSEALCDHEEDLDDWFIKSGNPAYYSDIHPILSLQYSILRSYILRAKRAKRCGQTWEEFEDHEISIDSMSEVRKIKDDALRAIHAKEAIDNNSRLALFERIRPRLCLEIWDKRYPVDRAQLVVGAHGGVVLKQDENVTAAPVQDVITAPTHQADKAEWHPARNLKLEEEPGVSPAMRSLPDAHHKVLLSRSLTTAGQLWEIERPTLQSRNVNSSPQTRLDAPVERAIVPTGVGTAPVAPDKPAMGANPPRTVNAITSGPVLLGMTFDQRYQPFHSKA